MAKAVLEVPSALEPPMKKVPLSVGLALAAGAAIAWVMVACGGPLNPRRGHTSMQHPPHWTMALPRHPIAGRWTRARRRPAGHGRTIRLPSMWMVGMRMASIVSSVL
jgi:hypothetical protein